MIIRKIYECDYDYILFLLTDTPSAANSVLIN